MSSIQSNNGNNQSVEFCMLTACQCEYMRTLKWGCRLSRDPHEPMLLQKPLETPEKKDYTQCPGCCFENDVNCIVAGMVEDKNTLTCSVCIDKYQFVNFNIGDLKFADKKNREIGLKTKIMNAETVDNTDEECQNIRRQLFFDNDTDTQIDKLSTLSPPTEEEAECPICMDPIGLTVNIGITKCGHKFCFGCILKAYNRQNACPCCRAKLIDDVDYDNMYGDDGDRYEGEFEDEEITDNDDDDDDDDETDDDSNSNTTDEDNHNYINNCIAYGKNGFIERVEVKFLERGYTLLDALMLHNESYSNQNPKYTVEYFDKLNNDFCNIRNEIQQEYDDEQNQKNEMDMFAREDVNALLIQRNHRIAYTIISSSAIRARLDAEAEAKMLSDNIRKIVIEEKMNEMIDEIVGIN
jgi:hypothetical protein